MNKDINQRYNGKLHGYWECYWNFRESLKFKCYYINDTINGYEEFYHTDNNMELIFHL